MNEQQKFAVGTPPSADDQTVKRHLARLVDGDPLIELVHSVQAELTRLRAERDMLRGVGCLEDGDGPCGVCVKCLRLRAENAETGQSELMATWVDCREQLEKARAERGKWLDAFNKSEQFQNGPTKRAEAADANYTALLIDLRALVERWREQSSLDSLKVRGGVARRCADELEARLSREPHQD